MLIKSGCSYLALTINKNIVTAKFEIIFGCNYKKLCLTAKMRYQSL
jgi:hypothetical protein